MVHLTSSEGIGLLSSASITISVLQFRTVIGVVPSLPALQTSNVTLVLLGGCGWVRAVLVATCSIPISILEPLWLRELPPLCVWPPWLWVYPPEFGVKQGFY